MKFEERVLNESYKLTEMETEIVDYIQKNLQEIDHFKIQQLAKQFYTVPNTITRLSHKLGYSGFSELKHVIKYEQEEKIDLKNKSQQILFRNLDLIDNQREAIVAEMMCKAKQIQFVACGSSANIIQISVNNFYKVDDKSYFSTNINELKENLTGSKSDLYFLVSDTENDSAIICLAKLIKQKKLPIVSLTHAQKNPLANLADQRLFCFTQVQKIVDDDKSQIIVDQTPLMIIMNSLFQTYVQKLGKVLQKV